MNCEEKLKDLLPDYSIKRISEREKETLFLKRILTK